MATFRENENQAEKKSAEIKKELDVKFHEQPNQLNEYIIAYDELQRELKELLALNPDELQKQIIEELLTINPFRTDEIPRYLKLGLNPYEIQKQISKGLDPLYETPLEIPKQINECLVPFYRFMGRIYIQRHHEFYQESENPEKGLWAWKTFKICTDLNIEIPSWVLKHFNTIASDLMALADMASSKRITNDDILKALRLKQSVKGGRSGINNFIRKERNFDIYLYVKKIKEIVKERKLKPLQCQDPFDIVGEHYELYGESIKEIYYKEQKKRKD